MKAKSRWQTLSHYPRDRLTHAMSITKFLSIFDPKVTRAGASKRGTAERPAMFEPGTFRFDHKSLNH